MTVRLKDPQDMTARELLEYAVKELLASGEDVGSFILAVKTTKGHPLLCCYGKGAEMAALLSVCCLKNKDMRPVIHMASDAVKRFCREYDAESSGTPTATPLTKEYIERLLKKGGKA